MIKTQFKSAWANMGLCCLMIFKKEKNNKTWEEWRCYWTFEIAPNQGLMNTGPLFCSSFLPLCLSTPSFPLAEWFFSYKKIHDLDSCEVLGITDVTPRKRLPSNSLWPIVHPRKILINPACISTWTSQLGPEWGLLGLAQFPGQTC